jgi:hypothetical protein
VVMPPSSPAETTCVDRARRRESPRGQGGPQPRGRRHMARTRRRRHREDRARRPSMRVISAVVGRPCRDGPMKVIARLDEPTALRGIVTRRGSPAEPLSAEEPLPRPRPSLCARTAALPHLGVPSGCRRTSPSSSSPSTWEASGPSNEHHDRQIASEARRCQGAPQGRGRRHAPRTRRSQRRWIAREIDHVVHSRALMSEPDHRRRWPHEGRQQATFVVGARRAPMARPPREPDPGRGAAQSRIIGGRDHTDVGQFARCRVRIREVSPCSRSQLLRLRILGWFRG